MKNVYVYLDQRNQTNMLCLQDPNYSNVDNVNYVRREVSRRFRNKKKEYLKPKIDELETKGKIKNIRDLYRSIYDFKNGYQSRNNIVGDERGDLVADSHNILARFRNHFSQLFDVHGVSDGRQTDVCLSQVPLRLRWLLKG
jgi:hypothetical protein